jgi:cytochrome P450
MAYALGFGQFRSSVKHIDTYVYKLIQEKKKESNLDSKQDLLSRFDSLRDDNGDAYPDTWIRDIILNFMIAGRGTHSHLILIRRY